jgi:hypothetical protein
MKYEGNMRQPKDCTIRSTTEYHSIRHVYTHKKKKIHIAMLKLEGIKLVIYI